MNHKSFNKNEKQNKKGGHTNMRTRMKKLVGLASGLFLALGMLVMDSAPVHADYNVANDSAAMVIRIRLNIDRSVAIATGDVDMDLGYVPLNTSTFTLHPASVTIGGNINNTELSLAAMISGGWVFDNTQTITSTASSANVLHAWAQFTGVSTGLAPAQDYEYFRVGTSSGSKIVSATTSPNFAGVPVGIAGGANIGRFENDAGNNGPTDADMDGMDPGAVRHLFTYFRLPPNTTITADQEVQFTLTVRAGP